MLSPLHWPIGAQAKHSSSFTECARKHSLHMHCKLYTKAEGQRLSYAAQIVKLPEANFWTYN